MNNRKELEKQIAFAVEKVAKNKVFAEIEFEMREKLKEHMTTKRIGNFLRSLIPINGMEDKDLYYVSKFFNDKKIIDIDLLEYFSDNEINAAQKEKVSHTSIYNGNSVEFENVLEANNSSHTQYIFTLPYETIARLYEDDIISYNFATQRKGTIVSTRGRQFRIPTINMKNVEQICEAILKEKFETNTITLNIRKTGNEQFLTDKERRRLLIDKNTMIDVIDGYHRTRAINMAWKKNPKLKGDMIICVKNLTMEEARLFIWQEAKGTVNNQDEMSLYDMESNIAKLIKDINKDENSNNILRNGITIGSASENTLLYYEVFAENMKVAWGKTLDDADVFELDEIKEFIIKCYSAMYLLIMKKFGVSDIRQLEGTVALNQMFMAGILYMASKMWNTSKVVDLAKIKLAVNKLDLDTNTEKNKYLYEDFSNKYEFEPYRKAWEKL